MSCMGFHDETSLKILEFQQEFKDFGNKNLPLIKRLMYVIYQKKLDQERYQVFHQVYPMCYTNALAKLIEDTRSIRESCLMKYLTDIENKDMGLEEFKAYNEQFWIAMIEEAKKGVYCYHCLKPAHYYCCPWRTYCSEECQKAEEEHYSNHPVLHKKETQDVIDKRCISKRCANAKPMPKLDFPQFPDEPDMIME
uniref:MYND-type domain-containing protein n=1 Tax=Panagrolaimus sp. JU765 TaxID=591449 RepID=A0AC34Q762_9BILA